MNKKIKLILIIIAYIGLILINTKVYAVNGKLLNETTRLRKEASTSSEVLALISIGEDIDIVSEEGDWYKVNYKDKIGYIRKDMISVEQTPIEVSVKPTSTENETKNTETENTQLQVGYQGKLDSNLDVKIVPSINSSVIATIGESKDFKITDIINRWCYIETENVSGWTLLSKVNYHELDTTSSGVNEETEIKEQKTSDEENETQTENKEKNLETPKTEESTGASKSTAKTMYVSVESLNLREKPENDAKIVSGLKINTQVTVIEETNSTWSKVKVNGKTGYVASKYLSDTKTETSSRSENETRTTDTSNSVTQENSGENGGTVTTARESSSKSANASSSSLGSEIVQFAKQYLGYSYVSGGSSPSTGFDCSGFTTYVYKHFGISLSRTSSAQASNGTAVSKSDLQPGDLLIFNNSSNSSVGHVGIYIGGNTFIHAANSSKGVITTSLSDSYYSKRYVAARRIIN